MLAGLGAGGKCMVMVAETPSPALARIERAIARIEAAARAQHDEHQGLSARHAALRARIGEAIDSLDVLMTRERER